MEVPWCDGRLSSTTLRYLTHFKLIHEAVAGFVGVKSVVVGAGASRSRVRRSASLRRQTRPLRDNDNLSAVTSHLVVAFVTVALCTGIWLSSRLLPMTQEKLARRKANRWSGEDEGDKRRRTAECQADVIASTDQDDQLLPDCRCPIDVADNCDEYVDLHEDSGFLSGVKGFHGSTEGKTADVSLEEGQVESALTEHSLGFTKHGTYSDVEIDLLQVAVSSANHKTELTPGPIQEDGPMTSLSMSELHGQFQTFSSFALSEMDSISWREEADEVEGDTEVLKSDAATSAAATVSHRLTYRDAARVWAYTPVEVDLRADCELTPCKSRPIDVVGIPPFSTLSVDEKIRTSDKFVDFSWIVYYAVGSTHVEIVIEHNQDIREAEKAIMEAGVPRQYFELEHMISDTR